MRIKVLAVALIALVAGCGIAVQHQRGLAALHTEAHKQCVADPKRCADAAACSDEVISSLQAWQNVNKAAVSSGDQAAPITDALIREGAARQACLVRGVPAKPATTGGR